MIGQTGHRDSRERQILSKAIDAFGAHGVRGASLRDIARDANVSLALISHHFGDKTSLVAAATQEIRFACAPALARLRARLQRGPGWSTTHLVEAWLDYLHDAFGTEATLPHLRLMQRLRTDPSTEQSILASLDLAEPLMRHAFAAAHPGAPASSIDLVLKASRAVLLTAFIDDGISPVDASATAPPDDGQRPLLVAFLAAAITASLEPPRPAG